MPHALRNLLRTPGFTAIAILTLALGIGACIAVFSIVDTVILRPLAYPHAQQLVAARVVLPALAKAYPTLPVNAPFYREWRALPAWADLALIDRMRSTLTGAGEPIRLPAARSSTNLFTTLRVTPALGRFFTADEDTSGQAAVAILSDRAWRNHFSADPAVVGRTITLDQRPVTVIGVLPADFRLPEPRLFTAQTTHGEPELYLPKIFSTNELNQHLGQLNYEVIGRLAPGVTLTEALAQANVVATRLAQQAGPGHEARAFLIPLQEAVTGAARRGLLLLLGAIVAVLLIACLNLSMLALARAERRGHDLAVRSALGASRSRLVREALTESLIVSLVGGALGCLFAVWSLDVLVHLAPADLPRLDEVRIDSTVLLFALGLTLAASLVAGLIPAWRTAQTDAADALRSSGSRTTTGGPGARRVRHLLVAIEAGVSTVLLATAALLAASFIRLVHADTGFRAPNVVTTELAVPFAKYRGHADRGAFFQRVLAQVSAAPGVTSAAITTALPLQGETWIDSISTPGDPRPAAERLQTNVRFITPDLFETLGIPLVAGRTFREQDRARKTAVLSAQLAAQLWPGQDPIGRHVLVRDDESIEVVGIVGDVRAHADQPPAAIIYRPYWVWSQLQVVLAVRTSASAAAITPALREAIRRADPDVPVGRFLTMDDLLHSSVAHRRFQLRLVVAFAAAALTLVALGLYGVVSHGVTQRTRELGIRLAFGATPADLHRLVLGQALRPILWGLLGGITAALAGGRILAGLLYETSAHNPAALGTVALFLASIALLASYLPARRAVRLDPTTALRAE